MHCTRKVLDDLIWVGADDRRLSCFEGVYSVPEGVSYNSYLMLDEKTVLFDTVDKAVYQTFFENLAYALGGRELDYLVISHMEPDHAYTIGDLLVRYPNVKILCNAKIQTMLGQFFSQDLSGRIELVKEGVTARTASCFPPTPLASSARSTADCLPMRPISSPSIWMRRAAIIPISSANTVPRCRAC